MPEFCIYTGIRYSIIPSEYFEHFNIYRINFINKKIYFVFFVNIFNNNI